MKDATLALLGTLLAIGSGGAAACSCSNMGMAAELEQSVDVVIAQVVSTTQVPTGNDTSGKYITEHASFEVIETIKGSKKIGDAVQVRSEIGPGPCGVSARNSPVWLEEAVDPPSDVPKAFPVSDTWLIFGLGKEPYELSLCSKSSPLNVRY